MSARASKTAAEPAIASREFLILEELEEFVGWPKPRPGKTFADVLDAIPRLESAYGELAQLRLEKLLAEAPAYLQAEETQRAAEVLENLVFHHPVETLGQLLWVLAADAFRTRPRGAEPIWVGLQGRELVELVDAGLEAMGLSRDSKKGVLRVIGEIRDRAPARYGAWSEERLRKAYYEARRALSGKSSKSRTGFSLR